MIPLLRHLLPTLLFFPFAAHGSIVTTVTDEDDGILGGGTGISLREAVMYSAAGDVITFDAALSGQVIRLTNGQIIIDRSLTIDGSSLPVKVTLSGDKTGDGSDYYDTRVFRITGDIVGLDSLIISDGNSNGTLYGRGGGICVFDTATKLTITNSTFTANHAVSQGGGIYFESWNPAAFLKIQNSTFSGNTSLNQGGAIYVKGALLIQNSILAGNSADRGGAVSCDDCSPTFEDTLFSSNSAYDGGAIHYTMGYLDSHLTLTLDNSILRDNSASHDGGAIHTTGGLVILDSNLNGNSANVGGAIHSWKADTSIQNTSLIGNSAGYYGGAIWNGGSDNYGRTTIQNSTISRNSANEGAGLYIDMAHVILRGSTFSANTANSEGGGLRQTAGSLLVEDSTFYGNVAEYFGGAISCGLGNDFNFRHVTVTANTSIQQSGGGIACNGFSMSNSIVAGNFAPAYPVDSNIRGSFTGISNLTSGNPQLAPLGDYGGPTHTMPPLPGSPAIDTGGSSILTTDQRGFPRDPTPDIGAVEYRGASDLTRFWPLDFDDDGSPYGTEQALGTDPLISDPVSSRNITAPVLDASGHPVLSLGIGAAASGTRWILRRSTDLLTFTEIYRFDGTQDTAVPGVTFLRTATSVTVTDRNPPPGGAFYRFEAVLEP